MENKIKELKKQLAEVNARYAKIREITPEKRADFGRKLNADKQAILQKIATAEAEALNQSVEPLDITAPTAPNLPLPQLLSSDQGNRHPLSSELDRICRIYQMMGFDIMESRQLDDEFHMFDSLNFAPDHPARDNYDTFRTKEGLIPPAHTSTMQHRALLKYRDRLEKGEAIAVAIPGRVFRNEDIDATHEHTFYQCEGIYVSKDCSLAQMLGILQDFFEQYYGQKLGVKTQPGYFPFTEPSLEFLIEKPAHIAGKAGEYLEMCGCGIVHPNVLKMAGIDPNEYRGFAWGLGIDRLVMLRYKLSDVRNFESGKLDFLKEFPAC